MFIIHHDADIRNGNILSNAKSTTPSRLESSSFVPLSSTPSSSHHRLSIAARTRPAAPLSRSAPLDYIPDHRVLVLVPFANQLFVCGPGQQKRVIKQVMRTEPINEDASTGSTYRSARITHRAPILIRWLALASTPQLTPGTTRSAHIGCEVGAKSGAHIGWNGNDKGGQGADQE